jgi:hypothetical protein
VASTVCDGGKGTFAYYAANVPTGTSSISVALLLTTGLESDTLLAAHLTFAAVFSAGNTECSAGAYARIQVTSGLSIAYAAHVVTLNLSSNPSWTALAGTQNLAKLLLGYKPTSGSADSAIVLLGQYDFVGTTDGSNVTAQVNGSGLMSAS